MSEISPLSNKKPLQENLYYYYVDNNNNREDETTQKQNPIPLLGEWDNNSEDETTQQQDPIPLLGEWDNKSITLSLQKGNYRIRFLIKDWGLSSEYLQGRYKMECWVLK